MRAEHALKGLRPLEKRKWAQGSIAISRLGARRKKSYSARRWNTERLSMG